MKLIEAMKRVKLNKEKITDLQAKISAYSANMSHETPPYAEPAAQVTSWAQTCADLTQECVRLLCAIQRTNLVTMVEVEVEPGKKPKHSIAEWVWRRREYAGIDLKTWVSMNERNLKEGFMSSTIPGQPSAPVTIVRHYDMVQRDARVLMYKSEPHLIDSTLEVINAITDLIEN